MAGALVRRFPEVEAEFVVAPGEGETAGRVEGEDPAGGVLQGGVAAEDDGAAGARVDLGA
ncbi:hypothetical protein ABID80_001255 [Streptomyces sp. PvP037]